MTDHFRLQCKIIIRTTKRKKIITWNFYTSDQKFTTGYCIVKKVSRLLNKLGSTPLSGFNIETAGYGVSRGNLLLLRCNFHFLKKNEKKNMLNKCISKEEKNIHTHKQSLKCAQTSILSRKLRKRQRRRSKWNGRKALTWRRRIN